MNLTNKTTIEVNISRLKPGDIVSDISNIHSKQLPPVIMEFVKMDTNYGYFKQVSGPKMYDFGSEDDLAVFFNHGYMYLIVDVE